MKFLRALVDALAFSSVTLAASAAALTAAAAQALGQVPSLSECGLAATGTLVVYNVDRLRDRERDRITSPDRTGFVERWHLALIALVVLAGASAVTFAVDLDSRIALLLLPIAAIGLAHRRLKLLPYAKSPYVATAWAAVIVGLPWISASEPPHTAWAFGVLFGALLANVLASNARDEEAVAARVGAARVLGWARWIAAISVGVTALAPVEVRNLAWVPGLTWLALLGFRADERYGLIVLDGALLVGGAMACVFAASR